MKFFNKKDSYDKLMYFNDRPYEYDVLYFIAYILNLFNEYLRKQI